MMFPCKSSPLLWHQLALLAHGHRMLLLPPTSPLHRRLKLHLSSKDFVGRAKVDHEAECRTCAASWRPSSAHLGEASLTTTKQQLQGWHPLQRPASGVLPLAIDLGCLGAELPRSSAAG